MSDHGAVNLTTSTDAKLHVIVHKRINAESQDEADKSNGSTKPQISVSEHIVTVSANTQGGGAHGVTSDLDISLPRKASVVITTRKGDVSIMGRDGDVDVTSQHGELSVTDINGKVTLKLDNSSARVSQVSSDVSVEGKANDISIEEVKGAVHLNGDFTESVKLAKIAKAVSFKTTRTDMEFAKLDGDLESGCGRPASQRLDRTCALDYPLEGHHPLRRFGRCAPAGRERRGGSASEQTGQHAGGQSPGRYSDLRPR